MIVLSIVLGLFVCSWSYRLYGLKGATFSLFLYGLDPNIPAHSSIIHSELRLRFFPS